MIDFIKNNWTEILAIYGGIVAVCTAIVKITPSTKDDAILDKIIKFIDVFSTAFTADDKKKLEK